MQSVIQLTSYRKPPPMQRTPQAVERARRAHLRALELEAAALEECFALEREDEL